MLFRSLSAAKSAYQGGVTDADQLRSIMKETILIEPLADLQYVSCADPNTLEELSGSISRALLSLAVKIGKTRLIDNSLIGN